MGKKRRRRYLLHSEFTENKMERVDLVSPAGGSLSKSIVEIRAGSLTSLFSVREEAR